MGDGGRAADLIRWRTFRGHRAAGSLIVGSARACDRGSGSESLVPLGGQALRYRRIQRNLLVRAFLGGGRDRTPTAPAGIAAVTAPDGLKGRGYDDITTDLIRTVRGHDSAQEGNANQPSFLLQQYGQTSGGPAR